MQGTECGGAVGEWDADDFGMARRRSVGRVRVFSTQIGLNRYVGQVERSGKRRSNGWQQGTGRAGAFQMLLELGQQRVWVVVLAVDQIVDARTQPSADRPDRQGNPGKRQTA